MEVNCFQILLIDVTFYLFIYLLFIYLFISIYLLFIFYLYHV